MYKLTESRLKKAEPVLERYRAELIEVGCFSASAFERELRDIWKIGYQDLKDVMLDMYREHDRYQHVALHYMEHSSSPGVVTEFKRTLAEAYGIRSYDHGDRANAKAKFWHDAFLELREQTS